MAVLWNACLLHALFWRGSLGAVPTSVQNESQMPEAQEKPCLCAFDIDRTLTGYQDLLAECPGSKVIPGVKDYAYLYDTPAGYGNLTLSRLLQGLNETFCRRCYLGIATAGGASLDGEKDILLEYLKSAAMPRAAAELPQTWTSGNDTEQTQGPPPLVVFCPDRHKHNCTKSILDWYAAKNISIANSDVYFFDDKEDNILAFEGMGYNARQVSCASRNGSRGLCGGTPDEVEETQGIFVCKDSQTNPEKTTNAPISHAPGMRGALSLLALAFSSMLFAASMI